MCFTSASNPIQRILHFKYIIFVSDYKNSIELFIGGMAFLLLEQKMAFLVVMIGSIKISTIGGGRDKCKNILDRQHVPSKKMVSIILAIQNGV